MTHQIYVHAHVVDGGAKEVGGRAVELFVLLTSLAPSQVLVACHRNVDVRVESPDSRKNFNF